MRKLFQLLCLSLLVSAPVLAATVPLKTLSMRLPDEPETLDWNRAHTPIETYVLLNIMEGLVAFDSNLKVIPALARSWTISPDGRTYTFFLRQDVKWSDGVGLKAKDFVYSWKRLLSPTTAAAYAYFLFDVDGAEAFNRGVSKDFSSVGVKAVDDYTLRIHLNKRVNHWIYLPTFWVTFPLREDVVSAHGNEWEKPGKIVTLGPYAMVARDIESKITLEANRLYYGKKGNIERVNLLIVKDSSTALRLYESGKIDFLGDISSLDLRMLKGSPELNIFPYLKTAYVGFVVNKYPLNNPKVRRAISMGIDKTKAASILYGGQIPATTFVPPKVMAYSKNVGLPFNPAEGKKELKAAGFDSGKPVNIEILISNWDKPLTVAQWLQGELKKNLGINVTIQPFDNKTFRAQLDLKAFPLFFTSWSGDYPDADNFLSLFLSSAGNNRTLWKNEKYDELVLAARGMGDPKSREDLYLKAQKILLEQEAAIVPLYYEPNPALIKPRVKGLQINPLNYLLLKNVNVD